MTASLRRLGMSLLELLVVVGIVGVLLGLLLSAVQSVRHAALRLACGNNLRQIGLALHSYHESHQALPPGVSHPRFPPGIPPLYGPDTDPYPLLPWSARLLPYLDQDSLFRHIDAAYEADPYRLRIPPHASRSVFLTVFSCPVDSRRVPPDTPVALAPAPTSYLGVSGTDHDTFDGLLFRDSRIRFVDVLDGTSSTLMVGERPPGHDGRTGRWHGGWGFWLVADTTLGTRETGVANLVIGCGDGPYRFTSDRVQNPCAIFHFWSLHPRGGHFVLADGSVRFLTYDADAVLPHLATRAGREVLSLD